MGINQPSSSLKWLKYDPKDYADIFPYAEAFEEIRRKIGQDFSLHKLWEWAWAKVFEIQKDGKWVYVVKLPHPSWFQDENIEIIQKVYKEIENQKQVILRYENFVKKYDKALIRVWTKSTKQSLLDVLERDSPSEIFNENDDLSEIIEKKRALSLIQIPKISEIYQGKVPIIIMDKIEWKSVWHEMVSFFFEPLFSSKFTYNAEKACLEASHSSFKEFVSWLTDQELEKLLLSLFEQEEKRFNLMRSKKVSSLRIEEGLSWTTYTSIGIEK